MMVVSCNSNMTGVTNGAETVNPSGAPEFTAGTNGAETVNPSGALEFTAGTNGAETVNPSGALEFTAGFEWGSWCWIFSFLRSVL